MVDTEFKIDWKPGERLLFLGIGNVGRQDDGLGVRLIERLEATELPARVGLEANYQLNAEDALLISGYDVVVFVDATLEEQAKAPFGVRVAEPSREIGFSTHAMSVGAVIALCERLYGKKPKTYLLTIPGYEWEIGEEMSVEANRNLAEAFDALRELVEGFGRDQGRESETK